VSVFPADVANFLALVDEVKHVPDLPTVATVLERGRLTLLLGPLWERASHVARVELLRHEASHVAHGCWMRRGARDPKKWNLATDTVIHTLKEADADLMERELSLPGEPFQPITLERLSEMVGRPLTLMPSERLYDLLEQAAAEGEGCGSGQHSTSDDSLESRLKASQVGRAVLGGTSGGGYRPAPTLPPAPEWIGAVLDWLVTRVIAREDRTRSWRRAHRTLPDTLPGSMRGEARAARFMLDASGSMGDELLSQLLAAVCSTPELSGSDVVVFDHTVRDPIDAADVGAVIASVQTAGGGTLIQAAGAARDPDKQTVWLTDGGTADGWPSDAIHDLWVVGEQDPTPPGAPCVRRR
jgi:hypothetical protein